MPPKFQELLEVPKLTESVHGWHQYNREAIKAGNFWLSIQASATQYCQPRENGLDNADYYKWEVALFEQCPWNSEQPWVNPKHDKRFEGLGCLLSWESDPEVGVGAGVPSECVQALFERCLALTEGK